VNERKKDKIYTIDSLEQIQGKYGGLRKKVVLLSKGTLELFISILLESAEESSEGLLKRR